jgi:hypothetical protein
MTGQEPQSLFDLLGGKDLTLASFVKAKVVVSAWLSVLKLPEVCSHGECWYVPDLESRRKMTTRTEHGQLHHFSASRFLQVIGRYLFLFTSDSFKSSTGSSGDLSSEGVVLPASSPFLAPSMRNQATHVPSLISRHTGPAVHCVPPKW